ncbi:IMPACT family protein [Ensifer adhaerens]|uniref:IMPACT family protein n=1 Tax=Ensifer adhaerens TaxID=106592 RepID=UPI001CBF7A2A|nr:YigZ family protein [Ensifer adhaerens]MBZ7920263.1 IMPACT family protein [Ensifer adhaerens]UAX92757.1 IMPACT family protein [Ensifer adhaerens]UAY00392.1 IMPACT family protein [Ensifer adhaerens]UAY07774.1 IMPACT family protein [Ensifer adhaerens]
MFTLKRIETASQDVKKSRFLTFAAPVADEQAAKDFLASHSDPTANHNCWAWRIGQAYRFSDDGEPSGTAGKPILAAIDGQELDRVAVVVTRWFGGILLGSGGLVRAYGGTAALCLRAAEKIDMIETVRATVALDFSDMALIKARLLARDVTIVGESFTDKGPVLTVDLRKDEAEAILSMVVDLSRGKAVVSLDD